MQVAIVEYNAGNIYSVVNALRRLGIEPVLTDSKEQLMKADRVIFPGQGEAGNCMRYLREHNLDKLIKDLRQPVLGICVGQQLLCRHSEEGDTDCIGVFDVDVKRFSPKRHENRHGPETMSTLCTATVHKVPCMGWNALYELRSDLFNGLTESVDKEEGRQMQDSPFVYFIHSYYVPLCEWTAATSNYILPYSSALHKDNFYTCQFHPEKSGKVGEQILRNFLELNNK